jgi:hypothetical protein
MIVPIVLAFLYALPSSVLGISFDCIKSKTYTDDLAGAPACEFRGVASQCIGTSALINNTFALVSFTFNYTIWPMGGAESTSANRVRTFAYDRQGEWFKCPAWRSKRRYYVCINASQLIEPGDDRKEQALVSSFVQTQSEGFSTGSFEQNADADMKSVNGLLAFEAENCFYPRESQDEQCTTEGLKWDVGTVVNLDCEGSAVLPRQYADTWLLIESCFGLCSGNGKAMIEKYKQYYHNGLPDNLPKGTYPAKSFAIIGPRIPDD